MNKNLKRVVFCLIAAAAMLFVACTKDENNSNSGNGNGTFTMAKADVTYELTLQPSSAEALRKGYDVFIDYYDANGQIQTSTEVNADNLTWRKNVTLTTFPAWFGAQFRLVPKNNLSADTGDSYSCTGTFKVKGTGTSTAGKTRSIGDDVQQVVYSGVDPHNGISYKKACRYRVQTDGTSESNMSWE